MYKAIALDLDGTLLNSKNKVSQRTKDILYHLIEKDIKVVITTGRSLNTTRPIKEELKLQMPLVTNNGCRVYDKNETLIKEYTLSPELLNKILDIKRKPSVHLNIYRNENWYVEKENLDKNVIKYQNYNNFYYNLTDFKNFKNKEVTKLVYLGSHEELLEIEYQLKDLDAPIKTMFSTEYSLEVINSKTSKASALFEILKNENISLTDTIAFGDGFNDYEMLKNAGKACIMGNAHYKLKESLPKIEVIGTNDNDSIAKYLENIYL